ncbi:MAG: peptidoglycan D,D-transpeptidase FtsI family protein [Kineosporiaceae bacterium]
MTRRPGRRPPGQRPPRRRPPGRRSESPSPGPSIAGRLLFLLAGTLVVVSLYAGRLVQIQAVDASVLAEQALENRLVQRTVPAQRGDVVDRHGEVLATSAQRVTVTADPQLVATWTDPEDPRRAGPRAAAARLAPVLGRDVGELADALTGDSRYAVVARDVDPQTWRTVSDLGITGLFAEASTSRDHPAGPVGAAVVGFVGADGAGLAGIELAHDDALTGTEGWVRYERSNENGVREIPGGAAADEPPVDGDDVLLTLDRDLQWRAEQALAEAVTGSGARSGTAVVLDARTGQVLAMAVHPGFDPRHIDGVDPARLGNSAVSEVFEPGSTSKVVTVAAVLEDGLGVPTTPFTVPDRIERAGRSFKDSHSHEPWQLTLAGVLAESSNTGTIMASDEMPAERLREWFDRFGLGRPTGVGLPGESGGLLPPVDSWSSAQRYTVTFGQGLSVTALQMASLYQTLANDGVRMAPTVVAGHRSPAGRVTPAPGPQPEQVLSADTAATMTRMLESVVDEGTGGAAAVPGYRVAGKTGTAERYDEACGGYCGYTASFAGYAPAEDPQVVVSVAIQDPTRSFFGGQSAAPAFSEIMRAALAGARVPRSTVPAEPYPVRW